MFLGLTYAIRYTVARAQKFKTATRAYAISVCARWIYTPLLATRDFLQAFLLTSYLQVLTSSLFRGLFVATSRFASTVHAIKEACPFVHVMRCQNPTYKILGPFST